MRRTRRKFTAKFKAKVAIEALQERMTLQEIASKYEIHLKASQKIGAFKTRE